MSSGMRDREASSIPVMFHHITLAKLFEEALVMRNNNQLEVGVILALVDDTA